MGHKPTPAAQKDRKPLHLLPPRKSDAYVLSAPPCVRHAVSWPTFGTRDSAASVSATSWFMIVRTGQIALMPPAVWPAHSTHSCGRPAWVVETIRLRRRSRSRRASSRLPLHSFKKAVGKERGTVWKPAVPGSGLMSLRTSTFTTSSDLAPVIACFHSSGAGASVQAMNRVPRLTPTAPSMSAAAMPRPSKMPPAATTEWGTPRQRLAAPGSSC